MSWLPCVKLSGYPGHCASCGPGILPSHVYRCLHRGVIVCVPVVLRCLDVWASASSLVRRSVVCAVPLSWCRGDLSWIPVCQVTCLSVQVSRLSLVSLCPGFAGLPLFLRLSVLIYQLRGLISTSHCFGVRAVPWNSALGVCRLSRFDDVASER